MQGGKHSAAAYTELEKWAYGSCVASLTSFVASAGTGMNLNISTGAGLISDTIARRIGTDAVETAAVPAASASFNRIDTLVAYIDTAVTPTTGVTDNTNNILKFVVVAGTAASTPVAPTGAAIVSAIGAGKPYMVLYDILLPQNAVNLSGITLTDRRKVMTQIQAGQFAAGAIATADIANLAITTGKIANTAVTKAKIDMTTLGFFGGRSIPYNAALTGVVTTIDTGLKAVDGRAIWIAYRCFNVSVTTPGSYSLITAISFSSLINAGNVANITDTYVTARYAPSGDVLVTGSDVAGSQRIAGKFSASTFNLEVWGQFGGASACFGVGCITYLV